MSHRTHSRQEEWWPRTYPTIWTVWIEFRNCTFNSQNAFWLHVRSHLRYSFVVFITTRWKKQTNNANKQASERVNKSVCSRIHPLYSLIPHIMHVNASKYKMSCVQPIKYTHTHTGKALNLMIYSSFYSFFFPFFFLSYCSCCFISLSSLRIQPRCRVHCWFVALYTVCRGPGIFCVFFLPRAALKAIMFHK